MDVLDLLRGIGALVLLAWLPGYLWVRVLAPTARGPARFVLSVALSVATLATVLYLGSRLAGIPPNGAHALWWALGLCAAACAPPLARRLDRVLTQRLG